jgi:hypothetical protein
MPEPGRSEKRDPAVDAVLAKLDGSDREVI